MQIVSIRVKGPDGIPCGVDMRLSDEELSLPRDVLDARILEPSRWAFAVRWPDLIDEYQSEEARVIGALLP